MRAMVNEKQYPHVRELTMCLACGGGKHEGLLVCWKCHNDLSMKYDTGYGPVMDRVIQVVDARVAAGRTVNPVCCDHGIVKH